VRAKRGEERGIEKTKKRKGRKEREQTRRKESKGTGRIERGRHKQQEREAGRQTRLRVYKPLELDANHPLQHILVPLPSPSFSYPIPKS